jgi:misacylated tRNA(Ala) deacylase
METKQLYLCDSYKREFKGKIQKLKENQLVLDQTLFHPLTGGVANDTGYLEITGDKYKVLRVIINRETKEITHLLDETASLHHSSSVRGVIDWARRYRLMRLHTAAHLVAAIMYKDHGALITGGQVNLDKAKLDFNLPKTDRKVFEETVHKANEKVNLGVPLKIYFVSRKEALKITGIVKLAKRAPPQVKKLRIVEIPGIDLQADGGPHVNNTREIRKISLIKIENKGRNQRRIYFTVD